MCNEKENKMTNLEQAANELLETFRKQMLSVTNDVINEVYSGLIPHLEYDTESNVQWQTNAAIRALLAGRFTVEGDYLVVQSSYPVRVNIKLSTMGYDHLRDNLIKAMPECPKVVKIRALEEQIMDMSRW